jgi:hypothetical protein
VDLPVADLEIESVESVDVAVVLGEAARADDAGHAPHATPISRFSE